MKCFLVLLSGSFAGYNYPISVMRENITELTSIVTKNNACFGKFKQLYFWDRILIFTVKVKTFLLPLFIPYKQIRYLSHLFCIEGFHASFPGLNSNALRVLKNLTWWSWYEFSTLQIISEKQFGYLWKAIRDTIEH